MKYLTTQLLEDLSCQAETNISKAIGNWQLLPDSIISAPPAAGAWSALQCIEHLNSYGRYYLPAIEKAISSARDTKPSIYFKSSWLGNYFYKSMLTQANGFPKKKMHSPKNHQPGPGLITAGVIEEFINQIELLESLLSKAQQVNMSLARVPISIAPFIKLQLGDTFLFFIAHINRHILQAERALQVAEENLTIRNPAPACFPLQH